jgi:hypothetical protein
MATIKKVKKAQSGVKADSATMADIQRAFKNFGPDSARIAKEHWAKEAKIKDSIKASKATPPPTTVPPKQKSGGKTKDKNWIQKAVNPAHKGYCTPMTKATCTPKRKALAKTFKAMGRARKGK